VKITIESTDRIVELHVGGSVVKARVWQGETASGTPVQVFVTRIAPEIGDHDPRQAEFERELQECAKARATVEAIPLALII
jgi:hypothetical protein